jgi:hypothetical protein
MSLARIQVRRLVVALCSLVLIACATLGSDIVDHSFGFDTRRDAQDAAVLDYRYGNSEGALRAPDEAVRRGEELSFESWTGPMPRGEFLYVKWRDKKTKQVYEDTVDLRSRLPADIEGQRVYFIIKGEQLFVYLITKENRLPGMPEIGPRVYRNKKVIQVYPDKK